MFTTCKRSLVAMASSFDRLRFAFITTPRYCKGMDLCTYRKGAVVNMIKP